MIIKSQITAQTLKELEKITGIKLTFGSLIFAIRTSEDFNQVDFAARLKISRQQLCDIERGRKSVSPKTAAHYAKVLGYSEEQFIRLALQDALDRDHLGFEIDGVSKKRKRSKPEIAA